MQIHHNVAQRGVVVHCSVSLALTSSLHLEAEATSFLILAGSISILSLMLLAVRVTYVFVVCR